jgi:hypothetical protein
MYDVCVTMKAHGVVLNDTAHYTANLRYAVYAIDLMCRLYIDIPWMKEAFNVPGLRGLMLRNNITTAPLNIYNIPRNNSAMKSHTFYDLLAGVGTSFMSVFNPARGLYGAAMSHYGDLKDIVVEHAGPAVQVNRQVWHGLRAFVRRTELLKFRARTYVFYWTGRLPSQNPWLTWWNPVDDARYLSNRIQWLFKLNVDRRGCNWGLPYWEVNNTCQATLLVPVNTSLLDTADNIRCVRSGNNFSAFLRAITLTLSFILSGLTSLTVGTAIDWQSYLAEIFCVFSEIWQWEAYIFVIAAVLAVLVFETLMCLPTAFAMSLHIKDE